MDILQEIVAHKHLELEQLCAKKTSLREALLQSKTGIIAEFKRKSPSKGWIKKEGRADIIPLSYQQNGAAALSILTDEHYFGGSDEFIRQARQSGVTLPILYKNFVIDEAQLYAAALCGASAVLLLVLVNKSAKHSCIRLTPLDSRFFWRCIQSRNWSTQNWDLISVVLTTVTSVHLSLM